MMELNKTKDLWSIIYDFIESRITCISEFFLGSLDKKEASPDELISIVTEVLRKQGTPEGEISKKANEIVQQANLRKEMDLWMEKAMEEFTFQGDCKTFTAARKSDPPSGVVKAINILIILAPTLIIYFWLFCGINSLTIFIFFTLCFVGGFLIPKNLRLQSKLTRNIVLLLLLPATCQALVNLCFLFLFDEKDYLKMLGGAIVGLVQYSFYAYACLLLIKGEEVKLWFNPLIKKTQRPTYPDERIYLYSNPEIICNEEDFGPFSRYEIRQKVAVGCEIYLMKMYKDQITPVNGTLEISAKTRGKYESYDYWTTLDNLKGLHLNSIFYLFADQFRPAQINTPKKPYLVSNTSLLRNFFLLINLTLIAISLFILLLPDFINSFIKPIIWNHYHPILLNGIFLFLLVNGVLFPLFLGISFQSIRADLDCSSKLTARDLLNKKGFSSDLRFCFFSLIIINVIISSVAHIHF